MFSFDFRRDQDSPRIGLYSTRNELYMSASRILTKDGNAVDWLRNEYKARRRKNPSYSLRAFSRSLSIGSGRLSEILSGKRGLGHKLAGRIADRLDFSLEDKKLFVGVCVLLEANLATQKNVRVSSRYLTCKF